MSKVNREFSTMYVIRRYLIEEWSTKVIGVAIVSRNSTIEKLEEGLPIVVVNQPEIEIRCYHVLDHQEFTIIVRDAYMFDDMEESMIISVMKRVMEERRDYLLSPKPTIHTPDENEVN